MNTIITDIEQSKHKLSLSILIYNLAKGGAERVTSILLDELKEDFNITLYLMNATISYEIPSDIKIIFLENSDPNENGFIKFIKLPFLGWKYKRLNKSDISLSFMNRSNYIAIFAKLFKLKSKIVISERITPSQEYKGFAFKNLISKLLIRILYPSADCIIPNAKGIADDLINNFNISQEKIKIINNPIDISSILKQSSQECIEITTEKFSFICVGRLHPQKNHMLLIQAMKDIDANLYIIGEGNLKKELQNEIARLNLEKKIYLLGNQNNPFKYIKQCNCFLLSSMYEGFPNVIIEALACGIPIISTDCQSGPREILAPSTDITNSIIDDIEYAEYGILVPVNNLERLEFAMQTIINDSTLRETYELKSPLRAKDFSKSLISKQFLDLLKHISKEK